MQKIWLVLSIAFNLLLVAVCRCETSKIKVGAIASLTGPAAEQGKSWLDGAKLAASELNKNGIPIELLIEDDATSNMKVASAFQKFANVDKVSAIIGGTWDYLAETAYPLAKSYKVPFFTVTNPVEILPAAVKSNPWIFTSGLSLKAESLAAKEFLTKQQVKSVALVYPNIAWGLKHAEMMDALCKQLNLQVVFRNEFPIEGYLDIIKISAQKIARIKPDLVYVTFDYNGLDLLTSEFERLKFMPLILDTQHLHSALELAKNAHKFRSTFGIYPKSVLDRDFQEKFKEMFAKYPNVYAAEGYDTLNFVGQGLMRKIEFADNKANFVYSGITGEFRLPAPTRSLVESLAVIMQVKDGVFQKFES